MSWQWNGAAVNDSASLSIHQSLADRCKKIHAGDEVIQVNHQTVVRPHSLLSALFFVFVIFPDWICIWFFLCVLLMRLQIVYADVCLIHMCLFCAQGNTCLSAYVCVCVCGSFIHLHTCVAVHPQWATAALLDLLLHKWLRVVPLVGSFLGCGCVTQAGWVCYFACHRVSQKVSESHWTRVVKSTSVDQEVPA